MKQTEIVSTDKFYVNAGNQAVLNQIAGIGNTILDVGCGAGDNASILAKLGHIVDGITLSEREAAISKRFMRHIWIHNLEYGFPHDINDKYDYIICSHVLEHIVYPYQLLENIRTHLNPGGKLIVALPNIMHYRSRWKLLLGHFDYEDSGIWDYTHVRWYTFRTGSKLLEDHGFRVVYRQVDGDIPLLSLFGFIPLSIRQIIYKGLIQISKGLFGGQLIYAAVSDEGSNVTNHK